MSNCFYVILNRVIAIVTTIDSVRLKIAVL